MKVIALSKEFFLCGWNIFDLCIVTASIMDLIFELVDGLSVLRGLRLVSIEFINFCLFIEKISFLTAKIYLSFVYSASFSYEDFL